MDAKIPMFLVFGDECTDIKIDSQVRFLDRKLAIGFDLFLLTWQSCNWDYCKVLFDNFVYS